MNTEDTVEFENEGNTSIDLDDQEQVENIMDEQQEETPEDSQPEDTKTEKDSVQTEDKKETEEKPVPFHEHPRFKEVIEQRNEFKQQLDDVQKTVGEVAENQTKQQSNLPPEFVHLYGDDDVAKRLYEYQENQRESIKAELRAEGDTQRKQEVEETKRQDVWVENGLQELKDQGETFNTNELMKVAIDFQPTDEEGNISLSKSLEILKAQKGAVKKDTTARKKLAANTGSTPQGEVEPSKDISMHQLRRTSFSSAIGDD